MGPPFWGKDAIKYQYILIYPIKPTDCKTNENVLKGKDLRSLEIDTD